MSYVGMREKTLGLLSVKPVSALRHADVFISRFAKLINQTIFTVPDTVLDTRNLVMSNTGIAPALLELLAEDIDMEQIGLGA